MYQASEDMYNLFDKVMILDKGVCVYFGPTGRAKQYFEEMGFFCEPRKSICFPLFLNTNTLYIKYINVCIHCV